MSRKVTFFRRDIFERIEVDRTKVIDTAEKLLLTISDNLGRRSWKWFRDHIYRFSSLDDARPIIENRQGIVELPWCGRESCGLRIGEELGGRTLGSPVGSIDMANKRCVICGKQAITIMRIAKTY